MKNLWRAIPLTFIACLGGACATSAVAAEGGGALHTGDHVAIIGDGLADRMQHDGTLEALIYRTYPQYDLVFRNLAFTGDEIDTRGRTDNFGSPEAWLKSTRADVVWAFFGRNESFAGPQGLEPFKARLQNLIARTAAANYGGSAAPRLVLFSPIAAEKGRDPNWQDPAPLNANLALYTAAMAEIAKDKGVPFIDLFAASQQLYATAKAPLTLNGSHLSDAGYEALAPAMYQGLLGVAAPALDGALTHLRDAVRARNEMWFSRYRTIDGYNVYGGRSLLEFNGVTNQKTMMQEMAVREVMTANRERVVWALARGKEAKVDDSNLPAIDELKTTKTDAQPYLGGEAAIAKMTVPKGVQVNLFASEERFPELAKPLQMAWDTKGRLWVCAWKTYPEQAPSDAKGDSILIFEDTDHDGKADTCTTFLDGLNGPTGFNFVGDGIIVVQAPDLWYVPIDPKTGRAGRKERLLGGISSADSHHQSNSMCLDPGGAAYLSDGFFHVSQVETPAGVVRSEGGAIFRYEPRTHRFERYIAYGFANPHGRVFDRWGNDYVTDATGNGNYFGPAISGRLDGISDKHDGLKTFWGNPSRPCPGTNILSSSAWPDEFNGNFLNCNVIGFQGVFRGVFAEDGSGIRGKPAEALVSSSDTNFRPTAVNTGPDGAVYVADWSNAIIGHMQYHIRDPLRDHQHGRIYRLTYEGRTLTPPAIDGQPVEALLALLKSPENNTRERAKTELGKHDTAKVMAALDRWIPTLDAKDPEYQHHLLEALWVKQWHNVVDVALLKRVLRSPDARARAAATRVLCCLRERVPDVLALLRTQASDENGRVRLEAARSFSYFESWEAADGALLVLEQPTDYYLSYVFKETMRQLAPWWKPALAAGKPLGAGNPKGIEFVLAGTPTADLAKLPKSEAVWQALFMRPDASTAMRQEALQELAGLRKTTAVMALLDLLQPLGMSGGAPLTDACRMLLLQPTADLAAATRAPFAKLATAGNPNQVREAALAVLMVLDGWSDKQWVAALKTSPGEVITQLGALDLVQDAKVRAAAAGKVLSLLSPTLPVELTASSAGNGSIAARFVRVFLHRRGILSLAEVQVFGDGQDLALSGTATQSSIDFGGEPKRAIDGKTSGSWGDGSITHTVEEDNPWWEVDLGGTRTIDSLAVWNRDADLGNRLAGFEIAVLDSDRHEVFHVPPTPAPEVSVTLKLPSDPLGGVRRAAIVTALAIGADPKAVFAALTGMLADGQQVPAAAQGVRQLPRTAWSSATADKAALGIVAWMRTIPDADRTGSDALAALAVGNELAGLLPEAEGRKVLAALSEVTVPVLTLKTVREQMRYDTKRLVVAAGRPFELVLQNEDMMPHNLVVVAPGARPEIGTAAQTMRPDQLDAAGRAFIPASDKVLGATRLVDPGKSEHLRLTAPAVEGEYDYLCTFPGHWGIMWGTLIVTKDPAGWLKAHP